MKPLLILSEDGRVLDAGFSSEKAYTKSLEQGSLWVVHGESKRVLPYETNHTLHSVKTHGHYVVAIVEIDAGGAANAGEAGSASGAAKRPAPAASTPPRPSPESAGGVLRRLESLIRERRKALPEGSYTTHLFQEGSEKIRKKLGEEAVELLLASSRERVISESADLLYHWLVLLAEDDIPLSAVIGELDARHGDTR